MRYKIASVLLVSLAMGLALWASVFPPCIGALTGSIMKSTLKVDGVNLDEDEGRLRSAGFSGDQVLNKHVTFVELESTRATVIAGSVLEVGTRRFRRGFWLRSSLVKSLGQPTSQKIEHGREIWTYRIRSEEKTPMYVHVRFERHLGVAEVVDYALSHSDE